MVFASLLAFAWLMASMRQATLPAAQVNSPTCAGLWRGSPRRPLDTTRRLTTRRVCQTWVFMGSPPFTGAGADEVTVALARIRVDRGMSLPVGRGTQRMRSGG